MELKHYLRLFRKWLWVIILVSIADGVSGYLLMPVRYQATTLIAVGDYIRSAAPDRDDVLTGIQLAETYAVIATTPEVIYPAAEATGIQAPNLDKLIQARILPNTSVLAIEVTYEDPALAASLANEIASRIITQSRYLEIIQWAQIPMKPLNPIGA
jgi:capsular polysaccharide biosynthesis protein